MLAERGGFAIAGPGDAAGRRAGHRLAEQPARPDGGRGGAAPLRRLRARRGEDPGGVGSGARHERHGSPSWISRPASGPGRHSSARWPSRVHVARRAAQPCSLLVVDVDDFQAVRDVRGDLAADTCIEALAERISAESNGAGPIGRLRRTPSGCSCRAGRCPAPAPWPTGCAAPPGPTRGAGHGQRGRRRAPPGRAVGQPARGGGDRVSPRASRPVGTAASTGAEPGRWRALRASSGVPLVRGAEPGRWRALRASSGVPRRGGLQVTRPASPSRPPGAHRSAPIAGARPGSAPLHRRRP